MWNRKLDILGKSYTLDQVDLKIENENRLPRFLIFRQVVGQFGPGDLHLEAMLSGGVVGTLSPNMIAKSMAEGHTGQLWTVVELGWYHPEFYENGPYIHDIRVFDIEGNFVDSMERGRRERLAAKAESSS